MKTYLFILIAIFCECQSKIDNIERSKELNKLDSYNKTLNLKIAFERGSIAAETAFLKWQLNPETDMSKEIWKAYKTDSAFLETLITN